MALALTLSADVRGRWRIALAKRVARISERAAVALVRGVRIDIKSGNTVIGQAAVHAYKTPDGWYLDTTPVR